jgi:uncharacterized membrane protein
MTTLLLLAFLIGCVTGLRSMTGPAVVCWGAHLGWLRLGGSPLAFLAHPASLILFSVLAVGELIADKLPQIPKLTDPAPLAVRAIFGAACGAAIFASAEQSLLTGAVMGAIGGIAGSYSGYFLRRWLTAEKRLPDLPVALLEDLVAVGGGLILVSRL